MSEPRLIGEIIAEILEDLKPETDNIDVSPSNTQDNGQTGKE